MRLEENCSKYDEWWPKQEMKSKESDKMFIISCCIHKRTIQICY